MGTFKKATSVALASLFITAPATTLADELNDKIKEQDQKIAEISKNEASAQAQLAKIKENVTKIENEVQEIVTKKTDEEQKLNQLHEEIADLKVVIDKRNDQLQKQARDVQANHSAGQFIDIVLDSESINEAMEKTIALTTLVNANNHVLKQQQEDKEKLETLQTESEQRLRNIEEQATALQSKQDELLKARLNQEVEINQLQASLATETKEKDKFIARQKEAEKKREEQLKALAEQKAQEEKARKAVESAPVAQVTEKQVEKVEVSQPVVKEEVSKPSQPVEQPSRPAPKPTPPTSNAGGWASPLGGGNLSISSGFGYRPNPTGQGGEHHDGIDFVGSTGTAIYAAKGGTVVNAGFDPSAGNHVIIKHADGYYSYYMHLSSIGVSSGQQVGQGTYLGGMGTTGNSTGVHLHFGVSTSLWSGFINPAPLLGV